MRPDWVPPIHSCTACDGRGSMPVHETDEYGTITTFWTCEGCDGTGSTSSCRDCGTVISLHEADRQRFFCAECWSRRERADQEDEIARLRGHA
jgi:DnaJ-class molecular chaperone